MKTVFYILFIFVIFLFFFKIPLINILLGINPSVIEHRDLTFKELKLIEKSKEIINIFNLIILIYSMTVLSISLISHFRKNFSSKLNNIVLLISILYILFYIFAYGFKFGLW